MVRIRENIGKIFYRLFIRGIYLSHFRIVLKVGTQARFAFKQLVWKIDPEGEMEVPGKL